MRRKNAFIVCSVAYFLVNFSGFFLAFGVFPRQSSSVVTVTGQMIFLLLSVCLCPFFGRILDQFPRCYAETAGCALTALGTALGQALPFPALFLAATGTALFSAAGMGENLSFARGTYSRVALFSAAGALGGGAGAAVGLFTDWSCGVTALFFIPVTLLCSLSCPAKRYPARIRVFAPAVRSHRSASVSLILSLTVLTASSAVLFSVPMERMRSWQLPVTMLFLAAGRIAGGMLSDRFGARRTAVVGFLMSFPLLTLFGNVLPLSFLGIALLGIPVAPAICCVCNALPSTPRFSYGLTETALLLGAFAGFLPPSGSRAASFAVTVFALAAAVGASLALFTDHCPIYRLSSAPRGTKGES